MVHRKDSRGMALAMAIMILLFLLPLLLTFIKRTRILTQLTAHERMTKSSRALAVNAVTDYMRQFSNDYYQDHMDPVTLARANESFYDAGFTTVTVSSDYPTRTVSINAEGKYGQDANSPLQTKGLEAVIKFVSDVTKYGTVFRTTGNPGTNTNRTYIGGYAIPNASGVTFSGSAVINITGSMIVGGSINLQNTSRLNLSGNLYLGGTLNVAGGATFNQVGGTISARLPPITPIQLSPENITYYKGHCTYNGGSPTVQTFQDWTFYGPATPALDGKMVVRDQFNVVVTTVDLRLSQRGALLLAENARIVMRGQVHGHVTVVCTSTQPWTASSYGLAGMSGGGPFTFDKLPGTATSDVTGTVNVENGMTLISTSSTVTLLANPDSSLAILASNYILFQKTGAWTDDLPATTPGYYEPGFHTACLVHVENGPNEGDRIMCYQGVGATQASNFILSGVRATTFKGPGGWAVAYNPAGEFATVYDPNLQNYPPPGLPERPVLEKLKFE